MTETREIGNVVVQVSTREQLMDLISERVRNREKLYIAFANANLVTCGQKVRDFNKLLSKFHVVNDGIGLQLASLILYRKKFPVNLNGTDLIPHICNNSPIPLRVFLFGAKPEIVEKAAANVSKMDRVEVCGYRDGYSCWDDMAGVIAEMNAARPDLVLVALGNPQQEMWIAEHGVSIDAPVFAGVGALFDYLSGEKKRAPNIYIKLRAEWLYRLLTEPRRLGRRYTIGILEFFSLVLSSAFKKAVRPRDVSEVGASHS